MQIYKIYRTMHYLVNRTEAKYNFITFNVISRKLFPTHCPGANGWLHKLNACKMTSLSTSDALHMICSCFYSTNTKMGFMDMVLTTF